MHSILENISKASWIQTNHSWFFAGEKRRLNNKPIGVKYFKALKDLEKGMTNKDVAAKYGVPKNTLSAWVKNKRKLTASLEKKGMSLVCWKKKPKTSNWWGHT